MLILSIKTDSPESELSLYSDDQQVAHYSWQAHRQLAETLQTKIKDLLGSQNKTLTDIEGIFCFSGPGSFTGLRIGLSAANALAYGLGIPIAGSNGVSWQASGIKKLLAGENEKLVLPYYGSEPHISLPKK